MSDITPQIPGQPIPVAPVEPVTPQVTVPPVVTPQVSEVVPQPQSQPVAESQPSVPAAPTPATAPQVEQPAVVPPTDQRKTFYERLFGDGEPAGAVDPRVTGLEQQVAQLQKNAVPIVATSIINTPAVSTSVADTPINSTLTPEAVPQGFNTQKFAAEVFDAIEARQETKSYIDAMRIKNPELVPFEDEIQRSATSLIDSAVRGGDVRTYSDYVVAYKAAVDNAINTFRTKLAAVRSAGQQDAAVVREEVVASQAITPQSQQASPVANPQEPSTPPSTSDYVRARQDTHAGIRRMTPMPRGA